MLSIALFSIVIVLGLYFFSPFPRDATGNPVDRNSFAFLEGRAGDFADSDTVVNSHVGANFQLQSVYPNIVFGMLGLLAVPVLNELAFLAGNLILRKGITRYRATLTQGGATLHGYIARAHADPTLKRYTTIVSLAVFAAVVSFEVVFMARILSSLIGGSHVAYYTLVFALVFFISSAVFFGGQATTFFTDNFHLLLAYIGVHLSLTVLVSHSASTSTPDILLLLIASLTLVVIALRLLATVGKRRARARVISLIVAASATVLLVTALQHLAPSPALYIADFNTKWAASFPTATWATTAMLLTAVCAPIFFNFIDFSYWHRLTSLPPTNRSDAKTLKASTLMYAFESPLTWLLPIAIGYFAATVAPSLVDAVSTGEQDPVSGLVAWLLGQSALTYLVAIALLLSLLSVAVSTVDSYLSSLSYLFARDMSPASTEHRKAESGRLFQFGVAAFIVVVFVLVDILLKKTDLLLAVFLSAYAPLVALAPLVVWPLLTGRTYKAKRGSNLFMKGTFCAGGLGLVLGIIAAITGASPDSVLFWLPLPTSFLLSWLLYAAYLATAERTDTPTTAEGDA